MQLSSFIEFIGRFHPVLVHLPIGFLLIALLLQWFFYKKKFNISIQVIRLILLCGMLAAVLACLTGSLLSMSGDYNESLVSWHMWMGFSVAAASMLLSMKVARTEMDNTYKLLSIGLLLLVGVTGHLGGSLTHGSGYLMDAFKEEPDSTVFIQKTILDVQQAKVFDDVIHPILLNNCKGCHGPKKQKGKLRMDDPGLLMKGGKNGVVIIPSKPGESELMKRLLLPENDDDHMPPKEKTQLNEKQIALLHWWIESGASLDKQVKDLEQPEKVKAYLGSLQQDHLSAQKTALAEIPLTPVETANEKAVSALKEKGVVIMPVAQNSNYLLANFVTVNNTRNQDLQLLLPLKKQLVWLKLGNTKINDSAATVLAQCTTLTKLQLNNTAITDRGIAAILGLQNLQSLNLMGTQVTAAGVKQLQALKNLRSLYLYQTQVNKNEWAELKKTFPGTELDSGGYSLPFLATDTMIVKLPRKLKQ